MRKAKNPYQQGLIDGINKAKRLVDSDIKGIYGIMAVVLLESGNTEESIIELMNQIQTRWNEVVQSDKTTEAYLEEKLPFELVQIIK